MSAELQREAQGLQYWRSALAENPDILLRIIRDLAKIVQSGDRTGRTGRRPAPNAVSFDALWAMLFPVRFSSEPFPVALREVMDGRVQREFAAAMPVAYPHLCRLLNGRRPPTLDNMEGAARAADISPSYFIEWRAMKLGALVTDVLLSDSGLSVTVIKTLALTPGGERNARTA